MKQNFLRTNTVLPFFQNPLIHFEDPPAGDQTPPPATVEASLYNAALAEAATWKSRFTGLQGTLQTTQQALKDLQGTHDTVFKEKQDLEKFKADWDTEKQQLSGQIAELSTAKESAAAELERAKLFLKPEFRGLAEFEENGLLPKGKDLEETKGLFTKFSENLQKVQTQAAALHKEGEVPELPEEKKVTKAQELKAAVTKAALSGDENTYKAAVEAYDAAVATEQQAAK